MAIGLLLAITVLLTAGSGIDGFKPRYSVNALTVSQIAQNYNATLDVVLEDVEYYDKLQEGCGIRELEEFMRLYESHLNQKVASFTYKNLLIEWTVTTERDFQQGIICGGDEDDVYAALDFRVTIR